MKIALGPWLVIIVGNTSFVIAMFLSGIEGPMLWALLLTFGLAIGWYAKPISQWIGLPDSVSFARMSAREAAALRGSGSPIDVFFETIRSDPAMLSWVMSTLHSEAHWVSTHDVEQVSKVFEGAPEGWAEQHTEAGMRVYLLCESLFSEMPKEKA